MAGIVLGLGLLAAPAPAGDLPTRFTLGRYIPADVWMFVHGVHNPERACIEEQWKEVFDTFMQSGIHTDVIELILSNVSLEDRADAEVHVDKITELIEGVRWGDLFGGEVAFARGFGTPILDPMLLIRGARKSAAANLKGLVAILEHLASFSDAVAVTTKKVHGVDVWSLAPVEENKDLPLALEVFGKGEIIGLTAGRNATNDILALMTAAGSKAAIVGSTRFTEALGRIKSPEDMVMFFDYKRLLQGVDRLMSVALTHTHSDEDAEGVRKAIAKAIALADIADYMIATMETDGRRELLHSLTKMQADKMDTPFARMIMNRHLFHPFDTFIPADATGFGLNTLIDLNLAYRTVVDFIEHDVSGGTELIEKLNTALAGIGLDLQRDVFSWLSGEIISVDVPAAMVTPMGGSDSVLMVRVTDAKVAMEKVNAALDWGNRMLQTYGQTLLITPAEVHAEGFRTVTHPVMAMFLRPVIGVKGDWLMIGTSGGAINKCLDVAAGKAPSILKNKRFQEEGIIPTGPVMAASFKDMSNLGVELAGMIGGVGVGGAMVTAGLPDTPEKRIIQKLLGIVMKLGPALQKIDFYSSSSSTWTRDGIFVRGEQVTTYKPPTPKAPESPDRTETVSAPPPAS